LAAQYRLIKASFGAARRTCGKASCRCRKGFLHEAWAFTYKRHGRSRCLHVPQDLVAAARQAAEAYAQAKNLLQTLSDLNLRQFAREVQARRTPGRAGRVSRRGER
jgi:hypothetical protein